MLNVRDLTCGYGGKPVLQNVSFTVPENGRLCILGPNGGGKTTLLRALCGLLPHTGTVTLAGQDLAALPSKQRARQVALLTQFAPAAFGYTVEETVAMGRYAHARGPLAGPDRADREAVRESLERTGLWALRARPVTELSGGQLQRVFLARAFAQSPRLLLLDEPTNHLDLRYQAALVDLVRDWAAAPGRCAVAVLHDINLALAFADRVLLLDGGTVAACAPAETFDLGLLDAAYGMDVRAYMQNVLRRWE